MTKKTILVKIIIIQEISYSLDNFHVSNNKFKDITVYFLYSIFGSILWQ